MNGNERKEREGTADGRRTENDDEQRTAERQRESAERATLPFHAVSLKTAILYCTLHFGKWRRGSSRTARVRLQRTKYNRTTEAQIHKFKSVSPQKFSLNSQFSISFDFTQFPNSVIVHNSSIPQNWKTVLGDSALQKPQNQSHNINSQAVYRSICTVLYFRTGDE